MNEQDKPLALMLAETLEYDNFTGDELEAAKELRRLHAENEELRRDAVRYRWLREQSWYRSTLCVVSYPKEKIKPGTFCPNDSLLDVAIDNAMKDK